MYSLNLYFSELCNLQTKKYNKAGHESTKAVPQEAKAISHYLMTTGLLLLLRALTKKRIV